MSIMKTHPAIAYVNYLESEITRQDQKIKEILLQAAIFRDLRNKKRLIELEKQRTENHKAAKAIMRGYSKWEGTHK